MALDLSLSVSPPSLVLFGSSSTSSFASKRQGKSRLLPPSSLLHSSPSRVACCSSFPTDTGFARKETGRIPSSKVIPRIPRSTGSSSSDVSRDDLKESSGQGKVPFGYTRKDVLLIGVGVTVSGIGLKSGLEFAGVDPLQAGNVVQLVMVLGLTVGWIASYIFRVSNKDMTYVQQLRDYENKVMEKRLEGLTEAELEVLLQQVEEEKQHLASGEQVP